MAFLINSYQRCPKLPCITCFLSFLQSAGAKSRKAVVAVKASANQPVAAALSTYVPPKKILMMGGSRFIGVYLARALVKAGHEVCFE